MAEQCVAQSHGQTSSPVRAGNPVALPDLSFYYSCDLSLLLLSGLGELFEWIFLTSPQRSFYLHDRFISASQGNTLIRTEIQIWRQSGLFAPTFSCARMQKFIFLNTYGSVS